MDAIVAAAEFIFAAIVEDVVCACSDVNVLIFATLMVSDTACSVVEVIFPVVEGEAGVLGMVVTDIGKVSAAFFSAWASSVFVRLVSGVKKAADNISLVTSGDENLAPVIRISCMLVNAVVSAVVIEGVVFGEASEYSNLVPFWFAVEVVVSAAILVTVTSTVIEGEAVGIDVVMGTGGKVKDFSEVVSV